MKDNLPFRLLQVAMPLMTKSPAHVAVSQDRSAGIQKCKGISEQSMDQLLCNGGMVYCCESEERTFFRENL